MRKFEASELVVATHNAGKAREIGELLSSYAVERVYTADELGLDEPVENGATFSDNAIIKALSAAKASGKMALADDSGLAVNALGGDPGIYSARWGGDEKDFNMAMTKVHEALGDDPDRSAAFICALCLAWPDGHIQVYEGRVEGAITWPMRGEKGFGYDPIFVPEGHERTFAEMEPAEKHAMSHRAKAFAQMVEAVFPVSGRD